LKRSREGKRVLVNKHLAQQKKEKGDGFSKPPGGGNGDHCSEEKENPLPVQINPSFLKGKLGELPRAVLKKGGRSNAPITRGTLDLGPFQENNVTELRIQ